MIFSRILLTLFAAGAASTAKAETPKNLSYKITYGSTSWNKDSQTIDQAYMFVREKKSGKIAKILLEETEPDSSIFSGPFSLDWKTLDSSDFEAFVIEETDRQNEKSLSTISTQIQSGKIKPSPLFLREQNGVQLVDVYDTKAQAQRARELFENQEKQKKIAEKSAQIKPVPSEQTLAVAQASERENLIKKLAEEATEREALRLRLEQLEAQRIAQLQKQQAELSQTDRNKQLAQAEEWGQKGTVAYEDNDYKTAETAFGKSLEFNPDNRAHHFMYGVSLYRNEKFNEALVALKLSPPNPKTNAEKFYFMGLTHYRLKELEAAKTAFTETQKTGDAILAPSAAFYLGVIQLSEENFQAARASFEWVLDHSKDPALDQRAEEYIEKIAQYIEAKKIATQKWNVKANFGGGYDSNILFAPDGEASQGLATDDGGLRLSLGGDLDYRIFYKTESEMNAKISTTYLYSLDDKFATADPFYTTALLPYVRKGVWGTTGYKWQFAPGYETIYMDANQTGSRDNILNTMIANTDLTLIMREDWFAGYTFEYREDESKLEAAADDKLDATKLNLKTQQVFLLDNSKKRALIAMGGYTLADAKGRNKTFNRLDFGVIYSTPSHRWTNTNLTFGVTGFNLDYNKSLDNRKDNNFSLLTGLSRALNPQWTLNLNGAYSNNASTVSAYQYSKFTFMTVFSYNWVK